MSITPATGKSIPLNGSITVKLSNGNSVITAASVTISGDVSKTYAYADFTDDVLTMPVKSLGAAQGNNITVTANVTNSEGTASDTSVLTIAAESTDFFTWDNLLCYFVLTDRFANGDTTNDHSYYRKNDLSGDENVATFHGGDIKGLTDNIDYFKKLGINAIWITAPYEQVHGWVSGKDKNSLIMPSTDITRLTGLIWTGIWEASTSSGLLFKPAIKMESALSLML